MNAPRSLKSLLLSVAVLIFATHSPGSEADNQAIIDETVALARAYLGESEKLDAVKALYFSGVVVAGNGASGTTEVVYKKPLRSQMKTVIGGFEEISTLNRTEAWRRTARVDRPGSWSLDFYPVSDIYRMQALANSTLGFLKEPTVRNGRITYEGTETIDDREARVLVYHYGNNMWYKRFIDAETGKVLKTESDIGMVVVESGEIMVDGIRFPAKIETESPTPAGPVKMELSYSKIEVNPKIDDDRFDVPLMTGQQAE